ncbi:SSD domain-containing protein [Candidatus Hydrogenisulfobacillus filiaventi]|uniref:SSD domain-containing protein n=1 Tax=Candidatus Hydrogenisulfobacillus filiaventi TaxID=2707344 RepID=A0A6F8ZDV1_9FIRM|nr:SSD domain-containing protein [Candidatus Hydrogenisulfobacillus filiaventi]
MSFAGTLLAIGTALGWLALLGASIRAVPALGAIAAIFWLARLPALWTHARQAGWLLLIWGLASFALVGPLWTLFHSRRRRTIGLWLWFASLPLALSGTPAPDATWNTWLRHRIPQLFAATHRDILTSPAWVVVLGLVALAGIFTLGARLTAQSRTQPLGLWAGSGLLLSLLLAFAPWTPHLLHWLALPAWFLVLAWLLGAGYTALHQWPGIPEPWVRRMDTGQALGIVAILVILALPLAGGAATHARTPAFPPRFTGTVWADRQATALLPKPAPAPWMVARPAAVAAAQLHVPATPVTAGVSLVPGTVHPPATWDPVRDTDGPALRRLNALLGSSLNRTALLALAASAVLLVLGLGSLPAAGLALWVGLASTILATAGMRLAERLVPVSPYALNVTALLAMGLSVDYAVFQLHAFRTAWRTGGGEEDPGIRARRALGAAHTQATHALPWSAGAFAVAFLAYPLALPFQLGLGFALAGFAAVAAALTLSHLLILPVVATAPRFWLAGLPRSLGEILDRVYQPIGRWTTRWPGLLLAAATLVLLPALRQPLGIKLATPTHPAALLPASSRWHAAWAATRHTARPSSQAILVIQPPTLTRPAIWSTLDRRVAHPPAGVILTNPFATVPPSQMVQWAAQPATAPPVWNTAWNPGRRLLFLPVRSTAAGPLPRTALGKALQLPASWRWSLTGGADALAAVTNGWFAWALGVLVTAGLLASAGVRWVLTGRLRFGLLAILFEVVPLLTTLALYPLAAQQWPALLPRTLPVPILLLSINLMLALALDYQVLFTYAIGRDPTHVRIADAVARTGGSITTAGLVMAASFWVLLVTPLPFLRAAGFLLGTNVLVDTLVVRSWLMPTTTAIAAGQVPHWQVRYDSWLALLLMAWLALALPELVWHHLRHLPWVPAPLPVHPVGLPYSVPAAVGLMLLVVGIAALFRFAGQRMPTAPGDGPSPSLSSNPPG